jgi:hypothetical protein
MHLKYLNLPLLFGILFLLAHKNTQDESTYGAMTGVPHAKRDGVAFR